LLAIHHPSLVKFCGLYREILPLVELSIPLMPIKPLVSGIPIVLVVRNDRDEPIIHGNGKGIANHQTHRV
jgi:hypothetical protein